VPESDWNRPEGLVTVRIDPVTGERVSGDSEGVIFETFREDNLPPVAPETRERSDDGASGGAPQPIF